MEAKNLYNAKKEEFETVETFSKRLYDTVRRYRKSMVLTDVESWYIVKLLARYYKEEPKDILYVIRSIEWNHPSKVYRIQWVKCLDKHYLVVEKR